MLSTFHNYASVNLNIAGDGVLSDPFRGMGMQGNSMETQQSSHTKGLDQSSKMEEVVPKMVHQEARMRENPEEDKLDPVNDVRRCCKKNFSVLSCIDKMTKEGCDHGSKVGTVPLRKPKESVRRESCEKDFISRS